MDLAEIRRKAQLARATQVVIPVEPTIVPEERKPIQPPAQSVEPPKPEAQDLDDDALTELELEALLEEEERQAAASSSSGQKESKPVVLSEPVVSPPPRAEIQVSLSPPPAPAAPVPHEMAAVPSPVPRVPAAYDPLSLILSGREAAGIYDDADGPVEIEVESGDYDQFLCFWLGAEEYAVNIMEIKEIVKPREVTEVPRAPVFVPGIVSLRGVVIPVYDMHLRLGLAKGAETGKERIVVVKRGEELCGLMVDRVSKVVKLSKNVIEQPPVVLDGIDREFVEGLGRYDSGMFILLDLERVLDISLLKD